MLNVAGKSIKVASSLAVLSDDYSPRYQGWTEEMYRNDFPTIRYLEPMTAREGDADSIPDEGWIAEEKFDGHRALCYVTGKGNRFFSRRISKKTDWYSENSDCVPHLRDYVGLNNFAGTVLDGEITTLKAGDSASVQSIMGALPDTAIEYQKKEGFAVYHVFDILYYKGVNVQKMPLWKRKLLLAHVLRNNWNPCIQMVQFYATADTLDIFADLKNSCFYGNTYFEPVPKLVTSFDSLLKSMFEAGKEGLIIKDIYGKYEQKRSKSILKLKGELTFDCFISGFQPPTVFYEGKEKEKENGVWGYWCDAEDETLIVEELMSFAEAEERGLLAVTQPHAKGWIGAIEFSVWKNKKPFKVGEAKGITEETAEFIKKNKDKLIKNKAVIEVIAQNIIDRDKGSLRHPRFKCFRPDKDHTSCTWENHLLTGGYDT